MATAKIPSTTIYDSEWKTLTTASSTGVLRYRKIGKVVYIEASALTATHNTTLGTMPEGFRPAYRHTAPKAFPLAFNGYVNMPTDGTIVPIFQSGTSTTDNLYFSTSYITD